MKKKKELENPICPKCGEEMSPVWENNGWDGEEGPRKDEITSWECQYCGYTE